MKFLIIHYNQYLKHCHQIWDDHQLAAKTISSRQLTQVITVAYKKGSDCFCNIMQVMTVVQWINLG